jgi:CDP-diacylglycerol pyrophosphatase
MKQRPGVFSILFVSGLLLIINGGIASAQGVGLWRQINLCIQAAIKSNFYNNPPFPLPVPAPTCFYIDQQAMIEDTGNGFAIVKAKDSHLYHFLTLPTKAITGIEDAQVNFFRSRSDVSSSYSPNYWTLAWSWLDKTVVATYENQHSGQTLTPDRLGLAINSPKARTEDQLHIHMACIKPQVQSALTKVQLQTCTQPPCEWSDPVLILKPYSYQVVVVNSLTSLNPFLIMKSISNFDSDKATLVVTGQPGTGNYYLLEDYAHTLDNGKYDKGAGEGLLDEDCGDSVSGSS